jgi:uncharacterized membrane protein
MSRRALITLVVLAVVATAGGVAGGLLLARPEEPAPASAAPTTAAVPPPTDTLEPTTSSSTTAASSTSTTTGISVRARLVQRLEDGLVVGYDASQPVTAVLAWGFGGPGGNQVAFPGPASHGSVKLPLAKTTRAVSMRVIGRAADGRQGVSGTLTARRLVRRVLLEVRSLQLEIQGGTAGIATGFLGTTVTPLGPGVRGPTATAQPYSFPPVAVAAGVTGSPLALRFFHQVPPNPQRTRVVNLAITYPRAGSSFLTRDVTAIGVTVHLRLRLTVTRS